MLLPNIDNEEEEEEDEQPLFRRTKVVNNDTLNVSAEDVQERVRMIDVALLNKAMDKSSFVEALHKKTKSKYIEEALEK